MIQITRTGEVGLSKNPAIPDGVECMRFCREMDGDNNATCFSLACVILHHYFRRGYKNCL